MKTPSIHLPMAHVNVTHVTTPMKKIPKVVLTAVSPTKPLNIKVKRQTKPKIRHSTKSTTETNMNFEEKDSESRNPKSLSREKRKKVNAEK